MSSNLDRLMWYPVVGAAAATGSQVCSENNNQPRLLRRDRRSEQHRQQEVAAGRRDLGREPVKGTPVRLKDVRKGKRGPR